jgi:tRNA synthetases class I (E and Q), anti-codon binding domain
MRADCWKEKKKKPNHNCCRAQRSVAEAYGDLNMRSLAKGDVIQLERKGYWIVDRAADPSDPQQVRAPAFCELEFEGALTAPQAAVVTTCCRLPARL